MTLIEMVKANEGLRLAAYDDATGDSVPVGGVCRGTLSIGFGHTGTDVFPGQVCTEAQADAWLHSDLNVASLAAASVVGSDVWPTLTDARQAALTDMAYNMGRHRFSGFINMLAAIRAEEWDQAGEEALKSKWAKQVPYRAAYDAFLIRTGVFE